MRCRAASRWNELRVPGTGISEGVGSAGSIDAEAVEDVEEVKAAIVLVSADSRY